jgi:hypothetical protein
MDCFGVQSVDTVHRCTTYYLLAGPACLWWGLVLWGSLGIKLSLHPADNFLIAMEELCICIKKKTDFFRSQSQLSYCSLGSVSMLTKRIKFFSSKNEFIFKNWNYIYFFIIYYNIVVIWGLKLFRVYPMIIMMIFNISTLYFHKFSFYYF